MKTITKIFISIAIGLALGGILAIGKNTQEIKHTLYDIRAIQSEARDALHVSNCWQLNAGNQEDFEHCTTDWFDYQNIK